MPHYTNLDVDKDPTHRVCKYCGRPLTTPSSMLQGCGSICKYKHRNARYRVVTMGGAVNGTDRFKPFTTDTDK